jgi:hypothetical protein
MKLNLLDSDIDEYITDIIDNVDIEDNDDKIQKNKVKNNRRTNKNIISEFDLLDIEDYDKYTNLMNSIYLNDDDIIESPVIKNTNRVKKNLFCENCNGDDIVEDSSHGIVFCRGCGEVLSNLLDL